MLNVAFDSYLQDCARNCLNNSSVSLFKDYWLLVNDLMDQTKTMINDTMLSRGCSTSEVLWGKSICWDISGAEANRRGSFNDYGPVETHLDWWWYILFDFKQLMRFYDETFHHTCNQILTTGAHTYQMNVMHTLISHQQQTKTKHFTFYYHNCIVSLFVDSLLAHRTIYTPLLIIISSN